MGSALIGWPAYPRSARYRIAVRFVIAKGQQSPAGLTENHSVAPDRVAALNLLVRKVRLFRRAARDGAAINIGIHLFALDRSGRHQPLKIGGAGEGIAGRAVPPPSTMAGQLGRIDPVKADALAIAIEGVAIQDFDHAASYVSRYGVTARPFGNLDPAKPSHADENASRHAKRRQHRLHVAEWRSLGPSRYRRRPSARPSGLPGPPMFDHVAHARILFPECWPPQDVPLAAIRASQALADAEHVPALDAPLVERPAEAALALCAPYEGEAGDRENTAAVGGAEASSSSGFTGGRLSPIAQPPRKTCGRGKEPNQDLELFS